MQTRIHSNWSYLITKIPVVILLLNNAVLNSEPAVKLLGILIDNRLLFSEHIDIELLYQRAGRSINVLSRLSRHLTSEKSWSYLALLVWAISVAVNSYGIFVAKLTPKKLRRLSSERCVLSLVILIPCIVNYELRLRDHYCMLKDWRPLLPNISLLYNIILIQKYDRPFYGRRLKPSLVGKRGSN